MTGERIRIGVCGIACEKCPRMSTGNCPHGETGCTAEPNPFCKIADCAFNKGIDLCFECPEFPCDITKSGPISYGYCKYITGKDT